MKKHIELIYLLLIILCAPMYAQDNDGTEIKVYDKDVMTHQLFVDSIVISETNSPIIENRNVAVLKSILNETTNLSKTCLFINGIECPLPMPERDNEFTPTYMASSNGNLYVLGERDYVSGGIGRKEFVIWKNAQILYTVSNDSYERPDAVGLCVDGDNVFIYGITMYASGYAYLPDEFFYFKNDNFTEKLSPDLSWWSGCVCFSASEGKPYLVYQKSENTSYQSTGRSFGTSGKIMTLWSNGTYQNLQDADRSKHIYPMEIKFHNGTPHVVGYEQIAVTEDESPTKQIDAAVYYDGNTTKELKDYLQAEKIAFNDKGETFILCRPKNSGSSSSYNMPVLKNGEEVFQINAGEHQWLHDNGGLMADFFFDQDDVYLLAGSKIWKNGELFWSGEGLVSIVVY